MRLLLVVTFAAAITFPTIAAAQAQKQIEVTNFPAVQDVNIVGGGMALSRFQIVGFTIATYTGNLGGNFGATRKCQLEFPESRMCNSQEVRESTTLPGGLSGSAWVDSGFSGCGDWTVESEAHGPVVIGETGVSLISGGSCNSPLPIACCAPVS